MLLDKCTACEMVIRKNARYCHACGVPVWPLRICESCNLPTPARGTFCDQCGSTLENPGHVSKVVPVSSIEQVDNDFEPEFDDFESEFDSDFDAEFGSDEGEVSATEVGTSSQFINPSTEQRSESDLPAEDTNSEKRVVTILFADISGFTQMSERLEPEDVSEIMNTVFDAMTDIIVKNGGTIDKYIGDCVMALFGAPRSYGDDAERAVKAALLLQEEIKNLSDRFRKLVGGELEIRVGLNTGMVVAGFVGGQGHRNYTVMGDAVNLASRMEAACERGRVLIASNTQRSIFNAYVTEDAGTFDVKGKSKPVQAFYVVRERETNVSDMAAFFQGQPIPFVSRQAELGLLMNSLETVSERSSAHLVKIVGAVGSGKSRLITEFSRLSNEERQARIVYGRSTRSVGSFMAPVRLGLLSYLTSVYGSFEAGIQELLASSLDRAVASADTVSGSGLELLDSFFKGENVFQRGGEDVRALRKTLFWAITHLLKAIAGEQVCVLVMADAHLADETLQEFAEYLLGDSGQHSRTLICWEMQVTTENLEEAREKFSHPKTGLLELMSLDDDAVSELVNTILAPVGRVPQWVVEWIGSQAEGRPLYVLEHLRSLKALRLLTIDSELGTWSIVSDKPSEIVLPPTIYGALQAELDALGPTERFVLQRASVVGRVFWDSLMLNICNGLIAEHKIERALQSLRVLGVLHRRGSSALEGASEYRFQSELFQQVCYDSMVQKERKLIHGEVARFLSLVNASVDPALTARHFELAERTERAVACLLVGLEDCVEKYSLKDATHYLEKIETILDSHDGRLMGRIADRLQRIRYYCALAEVSHHMGKLDDSMEALDRGFELLELEQRADETTEMLEAAAGNLHHLRGLVYQTRGEWKLAVLAFRESYSRFSDCGAAPFERIGVQARLAWNLVRMEKYLEAKSICEPILARYQDLEINDSKMADRLARHYDTVGRIAFIEDDYETASEMYQNAKKLREVSGNIGLLAHSAGNLAGVAAMRGDWSGAALSFENVEALWQTLGDVRMSTIGSLNYSECMIELSERAETEDDRKSLLDEARKRLSRAEGPIKKMGSKDLQDSLDELLKRLVD